MARAEIVRRFPAWRPDEGGCPACVQEVLLHVLLAGGREAMEAGVQAMWPLDAEAAFGALPTPLRLHADPRYRGRGVTLAFVDTGYYPHPDLTFPRNRIRAWVDATVDPVAVRHFAPSAVVGWPGSDAHHPRQWHGLMTSVVAAGNGERSLGLYRGLASEAELVLIKAHENDEPPDDAALLRGLEWLLREGPAHGVRIVNVSLGAEQSVPGEWSPIDEAVERLVDRNILVVAASGNDGVRCLTPPASAARALTVGGIDDRNTVDTDDDALWHSSWGRGTDGANKPEMVAPSIWVAAPVLPGSDVEAEAERLFAARHGTQSAEVEARLAELKLITPYYQHVDGTSFSAPLVASTAACMLEAAPHLAPVHLVELLLATAHFVPGAPADRQGAGALDAGAAVAAAKRRSVDDPAR